MQYVYNSDIFLNDSKIENKKENYLCIKIKNKKDIDKLAKLYNKFDKIQLSLYMNDLELENIPDSIFDFTNLIELGIRNNLIKTISPKICNLINLEKLDISYNKFKKFPEVICEMKNLQSLFMTNNNISSIPKSIGNLKNLKMFSLNYNNFEFFPECICKLTNLEGLSIDIDKMKVPFSITKLQKLRVFSTLSELPLIFGDLQNIKHYWKNDEFKSFAYKRILFRLYFLICKSLIYNNNIKKINYKILKKIINF